MVDMDMVLGHWHLQLNQVRDRAYRAPTPRERERWHALWLLARGWSAAHVAEALGRDAHTIGEWVAKFQEQGPAGMAFEQTGGPPALDTAQQSELKAAVQEPQAASVVGSANWNWKVVRTFVQEHFGRLLGRSTCFDYLHRLGFLVKRAKARLFKADAAEREAFVARYAELRAKWVLRGELALVDSTFPKLGEKASYYSGVCLETGTVDAMGVTESCTAKTTVAFLQQLRAKYREPLIVI